MCCGKEDGLMILILGAGISHPCLLLLNSMDSKFGNLFLFRILNLSFHTLVDL